MHKIVAGFLKSKGITVFYQDDAGFLLKKGDSKISLSSDTGKMVAKRLSQMIVKECPEIDCFGPKELNDSLCDMAINHIISKRDYYEFNRMMDRVSK